MSGAGPADDDRGSLAELEHVVERCDRYEAAWREGRRPRIEDYLAEAPEPERAARCCASCWPWSWSSEVTMASDPSRRSTASGSRDTSN